MLNVIVLHGIMLNVIKPSVVILNVIMPSVVAPKKEVFGTFLRSFSSMLSKISIRDQCYKTFYGRNLLIFVISWSLMLVGLH
jgi:hypothetical protein